MQHVLSLIFTRIPVIDVGMLEDLLNISANSGALGAVVSNNKNCDFMVMKAE